MADATKKSDKTLPPQDFLLKDYELKVRFFTDHLSRMWTRFNYFLSIESALIGAKTVFGDKVLTPQVAFIGAVVALIWYVMGAEDRFLVRVYRNHVKAAGELIAKRNWDKRALGPYRHVGEVEESSKGLGWELSGWRIDAFSTTHLAAWIPLLLLLAWLAFLYANMK